MGRINKLGLFLTRNCNFYCNYCRNYCHDLKGRNPSDKLTFDELKDLLRQAHNMGARRLVIAGEGEPLLDENLFPLIEYAQELEMRTDITSNISLVDEKSAQWLYAHTVRIFAKFFSFNPDRQDEVAGKKDCHTWVTYTDTGKNFTIPLGLKNLLDAGYGHRKGGFFSRHLLSIQPILTARTIDDIVEIAKVCRSLGLGIYIKKRMAPQISTFDKTLVPTKEQERHLCKRVISLMDFESRAWLMLPCSFEVDPFIDINGNSRFCVNIDKSAGNIRTVPLKELHREQMKVRDALSKRSPRIKLFPKRFRHCRAKRSFNRIS
ncbi:MAG: radical SAM protein [Candidatus Omnitrophica bacterium]|nr:radical SAM protein [Candidatus Omnitrophota bacterium]